MGMVLTFPSERRIETKSVLTEEDRTDKAGQIIILPVIHYTRHSDAELTPHQTTPRKGRRNSR